MIYVARYQYVKDGLSFKGVFVTHFSNVFVLHLTQYNLEHKTSLSLTSIIIKGGSIYYSEVGCTK